MFDFCVKFETEFWYVMNPRLFYMLAPISATHGSVWVTLSTDYGEDQKVDTNIKIAFTHWEPVHAVIKTTDKESTLASQSFESLKSISMLS